MSSDVVLVLWDPSRHGTPKSFSDVISVWNNLEDVEDSPSERILAFAHMFYYFYRSFFIYIIAG